jgi:hypothetical protein
MSFAIPLLYGILNEMESLVNGLEKGKEGREKTLGANPFCWVRFCKHPDFVSADVLNHKGTVLGYMALLALPCYHEEEYS